MLENLEPATKPIVDKSWRPAVEFDGTNGEATTQGFLPDEKPDFDKFLIDAGFDPALIEIIGEPRTSRWQVARPFPLDPQWLTAYRFRFRKRGNPQLDLPTLYAAAKRTTKNSKPAPTNSDKVFVIATADYQVGKTGSRGGTPELVARVMQSYINIEAQLKRGKYSKIVILDAGDIIEGISNVASLHQLATNDLSVMQSVDLAAALQFDLIKIATKYAPVEYASVGSNHCQYRYNGQQVGRPGLDDWGIVILQQLRRLTTELGLPVTYHIPQPEDESLALDIFNDQFHILGLAHGHQAKRPNAMETWFKGQTFGLQPISNATVLITGHFHHLRIEELGQAHNGGSRFWVQASTSDAGSDWYRLTSGTDSSTGITCLELEKGIHYQGSIIKL